MVLTCCDKSKSIDITMFIYKYLGLLNGSHWKTSSCLLRIYIMLIFLYFTCVSGTSGKSGKHSTSVSDSINDGLSPPSSSLLCPSCERIHCSPRKASKLRCHGGITTGVCGCCPVCAKLEGDPCGGSWDYKGKCDKGLQCEQVTKDSKLTQEVDGMIGDEGYQTRKTFDLRAHQRRNREESWMNKAANKPEGICRPVPVHMQSDSGFNPFCRPACTREYCSSNPRAICSARENAKESQDCQGECQHTSCSACTDVVDISEACGKCATDDFRCIRSYARCVRSTRCSRRKYPCKANSKVPLASSRFECMVPECSDLTLP